MDFNETTYKVGRSYGYGLQKHKSKYGWWVTGNVRTPFGYVEVYMQADHTRLSIVHDGYEINRIWPRSFTTAYVVTLARRFIEEMQPSQTVNSVKNCH